MSDEKEGQAQKKGQKAPVRGEGLVESRPPASARDTSGQNAQNDDAKKVKSSDAMEMVWEDINKAPREDKKVEPPKDEVPKVTQPIKGSNEQPNAQQQEKVADNRQKEQPTEKQGQEKKPVQDNAKAIPPTAGHDAEEPKQVDTVKRDPPRPDDKPKGTDDDTSYQKGSDDETVDLGEKVKNVEESVLDLVNLSKAMRRDYEKKIKSLAETVEHLQLKAEGTRKEVVPADFKTKRVLFPFTAIVGQEKMKKGLILNAINPDIGGILIRGEKGTGKSTAVRGLSEVLPEIEVVEGCRFSCDPKEEEHLCWECADIKARKKLKPDKRPIRIVEVPLNSTEETLVGNLHVETLLEEKKRMYEPGLLANAHRGILYIDEINLLDDFVVDELLDAASTGICIVEREGVSVSHPARILLIGTMNPEEGEVRPQLLDRIALMVQVEGVKDPEQRVEIIKRQKEFSRNPREFRARFLNDQRNLKTKIESARRILPHVGTPVKLLNTIVDICLEFNVDGHRADMMIEKLARANAAYDGRRSVIADDIIESADLVLPHRMRKRAFELKPYSTDRMREMMASS